MAYQQTRNNHYVPQRYLRHRAAPSPAFIESEIERCIGWLAQAPGYKLSEMRIRAQRAKAEGALGPRLDLPDLHDPVLRQGRCRWTC
jgi:uncharacterized protein (DUF885 family)